jgi:protoporphyrinogen/coproporphyrinogen III oxidase
MTESSHDVCIIGGGLSGLAVAHFLQDLQPDTRLLVLEKDDRPGGAIHTHAEAGYQGEWGAHGFLDNSDDSRRLIALARLDDEVQMAPLKTFVRYVCLQGKLVCIPQSPFKVIASPVMPLHAKIGVLRDLFRKPLEGDPSVAEWSAYRFGPHILPFADAVFTGTYAGDIERLKINAVMPGVRQMELAHGSVIRGGLSKMRRASRQKDRPKRQFPSMTSFERGMVRLPQGLATVLGERGAIRYHQRVEGFSRDGDVWSVEAGDDRYRCEHLVLAVPVNEGLRLLAGVPQPEPPPLTAVPDGVIATVMLGFSDAATVPFGFGYLAPEAEQRFALGTLFSSHMFPGRAPQGHHLLEVLVGGRRHPERLELDDKHMVQRVYEDIRQLLDLPEPPCFARVLRPPAGIPQLEAGYTDLLAWRDQTEAATPALHICGFGWTGIGINDMSKEAAKIAQRIGAGFTEPGQTAVKGVYF